MAKYGIRLEGMQRMTARIEGLRGEVEDILAEEIEASAEAIELQAKQNAPDVIQTAYGGVEDEPGQIRSSLRAWKVSKLEWHVGMSRTGPINDLAGFLEWGTGKYIEIPAGLEAYAMMWYVNGRGTILPQPFLFPAVEKERKRLVENLKKDLGI